MAHSSAAVWRFRLIGSSVGSRPHFDRDFYHPRYDRARAWVPDLRNTIYWNPSFGLRGGVENVFTFYTDDQNDGPYFLRIEGRTATGRWISTTQTLN